MYRAIPEVNRICAMAERGRRYRLHQEALARIATRPKQKSQFQNHTGTGIPSYVQQTDRHDGASSAAGTNSPSVKNGGRHTSLLGRAQREKQMQITAENMKIIQAIANQSPTICRADFIDHEMDHKRQVSRMTGHPEIYGFPVDNPKIAKPSSKKQSDSSPSSKKKSYSNYDPEIIRPMPKKFEIKDFQDEEDANEKKHPAKKGSSKAQSSTNSKNNSSKLDDIMKDGVDGLTEEKPKPKPKPKPEPKQQKPKPNPSEEKAEAEKKEDAKKEAEKKEDEEENGNLDNIVDAGVGGLVGSPSPEEEKKDEKDEEENNDE